jgi:hypothetical protein
MWKVARSKRLGGVLRLTGGRKHNELRTLFDRLDLMNRRYSLGVALKEPPNPWGTEEAMMVLRVNVSRIRKAVDLLDYEVNGPELRTLAQILNDAVEDAVLCRMRIPDPGGRSPDVVARNLRYDVAVLSSHGRVRAEDLLS